MCHIQAEVLVFNLLISQKFEKSHGSIIMMTKEIQWRQNNQEMKAYLRLPSSILWDTLQTLAFFRIFAFRRDCIIILMGSNIM